MLESESNAFPSDDDLEPEFDAFWPDDVPFPLHLPNLVRRPYDADEDAELAQKFQYISRFRSERNLDIGYNFMHIAAIIGDIEFLDFVKSKYGGIMYHREYIDLALRHGHFEFYMYFMQVAKFTCILADDYHGAPDWARCRGDLLKDLLKHSSLSEDNRYMLVRYLHDNIILTYPPHEYMKRYLHSQGRYDHVPDESFLISSAPNYPKLSVGEQRYPLMYSLFTERSHRIRQYLVEEHGYRFMALHLPYVMRRKRLYGYVLDHLQPGLDRDKVQTDTPFMVLLSDADLLIAILGSFEDYLDWLDDIIAQYETEFKLRDMADKWFDQPNLIPKIIYMINFLESNDFCDSGPKFIRRVKGDAKRHQKAPIEYARLMATYLRQALNLASRLGFEGFTDIDWSLESPVDLNTIPD